MNDVLKETGELMAVVFVLDSEDSYFIGNPSRQWAYI
jgi:hypothetical protein